MKSDSMCDAFTLTPKQMAARTHVQILVALNKGSKYFDALVPSTIKVQIGEQVSLTFDHGERNAIPEVTQILRTKG